MDAALLTPTTVDGLDDYDLPLNNFGAITRNYPHTASRRVEVDRQDCGHLPAAQTMHGTRARSADLAEYERPIKSVEQLNPAVANEASKVAEDDAAVIARVVATFPPLSPEQRERLAVILGGAS
ncbi:hypothetical protein [Arthrobacter glacialis]|uniref:Uncharacterized protein n=1 Tax=Arthrobacter glacialis TaxID=1664 RepID=A0A2S4A1E5_ARTGL|nr:hypothetical protein [Arthrobacter glacialis]POH75194.1 hypothetical protein CVS27_00855 [Arthrobacter glacialis]